MKRILSKTISIVVLLSLLMPVGLLPVFGSTQQAGSTPLQQAGSSSPDEPGDQPPIYLPILAYEAMQIYEIYGQITDGDDNPVPGVTINSGVGHAATTGADGRYGLSGLADGMYEISVDAPGYYCSPLSIRINVPPDATQQNFTCSTQLYPVTGVITNRAGEPIPAVTVTDNAGRETLTDINGAFALELPAGIHTLTPKKSGDYISNNENYQPEYFFEPRAFTVRLGSSKVRAPVESVDFIALSNFMDPQFVGAVGLDPYPKLGNQGLAVDRNGNAYLVYGTTTGLQFGYYDGAAWNFQLLDGIDTQYSAMALDSKGRPHIFYYDVANKDLKYIRATNKSAGVFNWADPRVVDSDDSVGLVPSIAIDSEDLPRVVYLDDTEDDLKYAYLNTIGGNFHIETVLDNGNDNTLLETLPSLALDSYDTPHISFYQYNPDTNNGALMYADRLGTDNWDFRTLATGLLSLQFQASLSRMPMSIQSITDIFQDVGFFNQIAVDMYDNVHIAYYNDTSDDLEYAYMGYGDSGFSYDIVDRFESVGAFTSLAVDSQGRPQIAYIRQSDKPGTAGGALKYAIKLSNDNWKILFVDAIGPIPSAPPTSLRTSSSIFIDGSDNPHLLYFDYTTGDLKYSVRNKWEFQVVGLVGTLNEPSNRNIALDSRGLPHIAFGGTGLYHGYFDGSTWQFELVDASGTAGAYAAIAMDEDDNIYMAYYDDGPEDLRFATYEDRTGVWTLETVDSTYDVGKFLSLALDYNDKPHISYFDETNDRLRYAVRSGSSWSRATLDDEGAVGGYTSIAIDHNNRPHIVYSNFTEYYLKYIYQTSSGWQAPEDLPTGGKVRSFVSLDLDSHDRPYVAYFEDAGEDDIEYDVLKMIYDAGYGWDVDTIDSDNSVGWWNSMQLDSYNNAHVSYYDRTVGKLKYATGDPYDWQAEFVDTMGKIPMGADISLYGGYTALTLDRADRPYFIYYDIDNNVLKFAKINQWEFQTAATAAVTEPGRPSISVDVAGRPHITYTDGNVIYTRNTGFLWQAEPSLGVGGYPTIAVEKFGNQGWPYLAFYDTANQDLYYNRRDGTGWLTPSAVVDSSSNDVGKYASIAIKQLGSEVTVHVAYFDETDDQLKYARIGHDYPLAGSVQIEVVDTVGAVGSYPSIALDSNNVPHITYYDIKNKDLKYAYRLGIDSWTTEVVEANGKVGLFSSLAMDSQDRPHVAYFDDETDDLRYAYKSGGLWNYDVVDTVESTGWYVALKLDSADNPHITYYDYTNQNLKHAFWYRYNFVIELVDIAGDVGMYSSLDIDAADELHIAYYDASLGIVKYARSVDW
jgi:hypothetical protein